MAKTFGKSFVVAAVTLMILGLRVAEAGVLGNPIGTMGKGNVSLGVEYDYRRGMTNNDVAVGSVSSGEVEYRSSRYLARAGLGAADWLDLFFRIGAADLGFPEESPGEPRFSGSTRLAIGGGFTLQLYGTDNTNDDELTARLLLIGQGLRYGSHGDVLVPTEYQGVDLAYHNEYTWNELDAGLLLSLTTPALDSRGNVRLTPYVGVEKSFIRGENVRSECLVVDGQRSTCGLERVDFADDGLTLRPVAGVEINMPQGYAISFEVTVIAADELSFGVGLSQVTAMKRKAVKDKASDHRWER